MFLENTCSPKVLMHSTFIDNSKERLEEKIVNLQTSLEKRSKITKYGF